MLILNHVWSHRINENQSRKRTLWSVICSSYDKYCNNTKIHLCCFFNRCLKMFYHKNDKEKKCLLFPKLDYTLMSYALPWRIVYYALFWKSSSAWSTGSIRWAAALGWPSNGAYPLREQMHMRDDFVTLTHSCIQIIAQLGQLHTACQDIGFLACGNRIDFSAW